MGETTGRRIIASAIVLLVAVTLWAGRAPAARADLIVEPAPKVAAPPKPRVVLDGPPAASITIPLLVGGAIAVAAFSVYSLFALSRAAKESNAALAGSDASPKADDDTPTDTEGRAD